MVKKWPPAPSLLAIGPRTRQSAEVWVALAAVADGLGMMVWITAGAAADGLSVRGFTVDAQGRTHPVPAGSIPASHKGLLDGGQPQRGGFGRTGGQFYGIAAEPS